MLTTRTNSCQPSELRVGVPKSETARPGCRTDDEIGALISIEAFCLRATTAREILDARKREEAERVGRVLPRIASVPGGAAGAALRGVTDPPPAGGCCQ